MSVCYNCRAKSVPLRTENEGGCALEETFSGYCRNIDAPRLVFCERDGDESEVDCDYFCCPYAASCPVGAQIEQFLRCD